MTATAATTSRGGSIEGLNGLRAVAAIGVALLHTWAYGIPSAGSPAQLGGLQVAMPLLALGVTLFFTLSGFLLYRPFAGALLDGRQLPPMRAYARRRILRVYPAYWAVLVVVAVIMPAAIVHAERGYALTHLRDRPGILALDALLLQGYWPAANVTGIGPAWTLVVEMAFYAVLPVLAALSAGLGSLAALRERRVMLAAMPIAALFAVGWSGKAAALLWRPAVVTGSTGWDDTWYSVLLRSFWVHADHFCAGMAVAMGTTIVGRRGRLPGWTAGAAAAGSVIATAVIVALRAAGLPEPVFESAMTVPFALLLLAVVLPATTPVRPVRLLVALQWRGLAAAGAASYSIYLWHEPVVRWMARQGWMAGGDAGFARNVAVVALVVGGLSSATYLLVERPLLARRRGQAAPQRDAAIRSL